MEASLAEQEPGHEKIVIPFHEHTEEFIYMLQGELEIELDGTVYVPEAGDSVHFEGGALHRLAARGNETLRFISAITPPIF